MRRENRNSPYKNAVNISKNSTAQEGKNLRKRGYRSLSVQKKTLGTERRPIWKQELGSRKGSDIPHLASRGAEQCPGSVHLTRNPHTEESVQEAGLSLYL